MAKCLLKYDWVKLPREALPQGKGIMGFWMKLASRAAFRKGQARYCGHVNEVMPGMWSGGIVGLKSILGVRSRTQALKIMDALSSLGYIKYELDAQTKKLSYNICDWVTGLVAAIGGLIVLKNIQKHRAGVSRYDEDDEDEYDEDE